MTTKQNNMLQSFIASLIVSLLVTGVGYFAYRKAVKSKATVRNKNEALKDCRIARWVTMTGVTVLAVLPYIVVSLWSAPVNPIVFYSTLIAAGLFMIYLTYFIGENGIPVSLSDSFYKGMGYVFTVMCFVVAISTAIGLFELTAGKWYQFFVLLSATLLFVGAAPMFKDKGTEKKVHFICAAACGISSQIIVILSGYWILPAVLFPVAILIILKNGNRVFWIEMAAFASAFATMELMTII